MGEAINLVNNFKVSEVKLVCGFDKEETNKETKKETKSETKKQLLKVKGNNKKNSLINSSYFFYLFLPVLALSANIPSI